MLGLPAAVFVEEREGRTCLYVFGPDGLPPAGDWAEELERALAGEIPRQVGPARPGRTVEGCLAPGAWGGLDGGGGPAAPARSAGRDRRGGPVLPGGPGHPGRPVRPGCALEERWRPGIPAFRGERGGFALSARDERGAEVDPGQLLAVLVLIEMENGAGKAAVSPGASAAAELVAAGYGGTVLRLGRDGTEARTLYAAQPWMGQAPAAAVRLCSRMGVAGQRLERLVAKTPRFAASRREVLLTADGARVISALAGEPGSRREGAGLRLRTGEGWVYLAPAPGGRCCGCWPRGPTWSWPPSCATASPGWPPGRTGRCLGTVHKTRTNERIDVPRKQTVYFQEKSAILYHDLIWFIRGRGRGDRTRLPRLNNFSGPPHPRRRRRRDPGTSGQRTRRAKGAGAPDRRDRAGPAAARRPAAARIGGGAPCPGRHGRPSAPFSAYMTAAPANRPTAL